MLLLLTFTLASLCPSHADDLLNGTYLLLPTREVIAGTQGPCLSVTTTEGAPFVTSAFPTAVPWADKHAHSLVPFWFEAPAKIYALGVLVGSGLNLGFYLNLYDRDFNLLFTTGTCGDPYRNLLASTIVVCSTGERQISAGRYYVDLFCYAECTVRVRQTTQTTAHINYQRFQPPYLPTPIQLNLTDMKTWRSQPAVFMVTRPMAQFTSGFQNGAPCSASPDCASKCCCSVEGGELCFKDKGCVDELEGRCL